MFRVVLINNLLAVFCDAVPLPTYSACKYSIYVCRTQRKVILISHEVG
jgi:hypothetical protein